MHLLLPLLQLLRSLHRRSVPTSCSTLSKLSSQDPSQKTISSPAASPGLGVILVPGRKKRKRQIGGYQPGLLGFNADHVDSTPNPVDPNTDLPTRKRARISISGAKLLPVPTEKICIRGLEGLLKKPVRDEISKGAPNTGPRISEKGKKVKGSRNKARNKAGAPAKLKRSYLPPCEEPEKIDVLITPTDIANVLRTVTSDNEADQTCMDIEVDMSGEPPPRGRSPTPVQHPQTPQTPPLAMGELDASNRPSQRTESTQEVINVFDFDLNLGWDEEHDADLQRALQLDCEMHSSPTRPTVCTPSIIELDDAIDFNSGPSGDYPCNLPYGGVPGVGYSWECHDLAPFATEAATFTGVYLHGPSKKTSDVCEANGVSEEQVQGPFAPDVVDLYRQTIEDQLRVWTENPRTGISPNIVDELEVLNEELAMRVEKRKLAEGTTGVSRPHEKSDIQKFIELDLKLIPSLLEGEEAVVPESPDVVQQTTPGGRFITQVTVASPSRVGLIGSNRLSTSHGAFAIVDSEIRASDEGVGTNRRPSLFAAKPEPQEPILPQSPAPRGIRISITGSKSAEPTAPSKRTVPASRVTRSQSSKKSSKPTIEELERIMLKRLNLTPKALASHNPPVWEVSELSTYTCWILSEVPFAGSRSFAPQKTIPQRK